MTDFKMNIFKTEVKNILCPPYATTNIFLYLLSSFLILVKSGCATFQKLVDGKLVASSVADDAKKEF